MRTSFGNKSPNQKLKLTLKLKTQQFMFEDNQLEVGWVWGPGGGGGEREREKERGMKLTVPDGRNDKGGNQPVSRRSMKSYILIYSRLKESFIVLDSQQKRPSFLCPQYPQSISLDGYDITLYKTVHNLGVSLDPTLFPTVNLLCLLYMLSRSTPDQCNTPLPL